MDTNTPVELKPFHESIVDAINNCFPSDLNTLAGLIKITIIPKNHAAIIAALENRTKNMMFFYQDVVVSVQEQQRLAEEKLALKKEDKGESSL